MFKILVIVSLSILVRDSHLVPLPNADESNVYMGHSPTSSMATPTTTSIISTPNLTSPKSKTNSIDVKIKEDYEKRVPHIDRSLTQIAYPIRPNLSISTDQNSSMDQINHLNISKFTVQELIKYIWVIPILILLMTKICMACSIIHNLRKIIIKLQYIQNGINESNRLYRYFNSSSRLSLPQIAEHLDDQGYNVPQSPTPTSLPPPPPPMPTYPINIR